MSLLAESQQDTLSDVLVVRIQDELTVVLGTDFQKNAKNASSIGTLEHAQRNLSEIEIRKVRSELLQFLSDLGVAPSEKIREFLEATKPFKSAPNSPLPALELPRFDPVNDNHDLRTLDTRLPGVYWVALLDWDDTLYQTESKNSIILHQFAKFLRKHHSDDFQPDNGDLEALNELIKYCDEWEHERTLASQKRENVVVRDYTKAIRESGAKSAAAFQGMNIEKLKEYGRKFVESEDFGGRFFEYTFPVIQKLRDHGILPVVVTGAPDFLVPALLQKADLNYGNGMTYQIDDEGCLTGKVEVHMGTADGKKYLGEEMVQKGYADAVGIGNSEGDMGILKCTANKDPIKHDVHGGGVLVNGTKAVQSEVKRNYSKKRTRVVTLSDEEDELDTDDRADDKIAALGVVLKALFYPLHDYVAAKAAEEKGQPKLMDELIRKIEEKKAKGHIENIENIKRIRDALRDHGLTQDEIEDTLNRFYPKIVVKDVMKDYMLDLRDEARMKVWLDKLQKVAKKTKEVAELTREEISKIIILNNILQSHGGSIPPEEEEEADESIGSMELETQTEEGKK